MFKYVPFIACQLQVNILKDFMVYGYSDEKDKTTVKTDLNNNEGGQDEQIFTECNY